MKPHTPIPLVLCEGKEDLLVMETLAREAGIGAKLKFEDYGGESNLRKYLVNLKARPEFKRGELSRILVTRDADANHADAWAAVKGAILSAFSCEPSTPGAWMPTGDGPQIAAWIIPGNNRPGMIETLCLESARAKAPDVFACLDSFVSCLAGIHGETPHEKARFALWTIAAQGPGAKDRLSLQYAIPNLPIGWDDQAFVPLRELLVEIGS